MVRCLLKDREIIEFLWLFLYIVSCDINSELFFERQNLFIKIFIYMDEQKIDGRGYICFRVLIGIFYKKNVMYYKSYFINLILSN